MTQYLFAPEPVFGLPVNDEEAAYPVRRIFCVGRNYAAHATEMGYEVDREAPFYFTKSVHSIGNTGQTYPYPPVTKDYHFELELVLAMGADAFQIDVKDAGATIFGYGCGLDMTRRDLQIASRKIQRPWSVGKDVENSAILAPLTKAAALGEIGPQRIVLTQNGDIQQDARLSDMVWNPAEIVSDLSRFYHLGAGDLIMTGTPAGVGPVQPGDHLEGQIDGLDPISLTIGAAE